MSIAKPFKRTVRQLADGSYHHSGNGGYVRNSGYAVDGPHYLRGFQVLEKDTLELFDYIEPSDINLPCYSFRTLELLGAHMRGDRGQLSGDLGREWLRSRDKSQFEFEHD
jgi:hypothetical protein